MGKRAMTDGYDVSFGRALLLRPETLSPTLPPLEKESRGPSPGVCSKRAERATVERVDFRLARTSGGRGLKHLGT